MIKKRPVKILLSIIALSLLGSCVTYQRCTDKFGQYGIDTVKVPYSVNVPYEVKVKPDSATVAIYLDSLLRLKKDTIYTFKSDSSDLILSYWIDKYKLLRFKASKPALIIRDTIKVKGEILYLPSKLVDKPSKWMLFWSEYKFYSAIILPLLLVLLWLLKK